MSAPASASPGPATSSLPRRSLARNSVLNLLGLGAPLLVAVAAIPPVVAGLGPERFGVLGLVWVGVAYLGLLDVGLGRATTRFAADAIGRADEGELAVVVSTSARIQFVTGILGGALVAIAVPYVARDFLELSPGVEREAIACFLLLAAAAPVVVLTNTFRGLLEAGQRFDVVNAVRLPVSTTNFLVPLLGVVAGWTLQGIVAWMVVARVLGLIAYAASCLRLWPALRGRVRRGRETTRRMFGYAGWITVSAIVSPILVYIDRFMIGGLVSMVAVGFYTAPHEIVTRLDIVPAAIVATVFPAFAALHGVAGQADTGVAIEALFVRALKYLLLLVAPLLIALIVLAGPVLTLWLGDAHAAQSTTPLRLLALGMLLNAAAFVPHALVQAAGRPDLTAKFHLVELPIHLAVVGLFVSAWGITGAAAAWALRCGLDAALLFGAVSRLRLVPLRAVAGGGFIRVLAALAGFAVAAGVLGVLISGPAFRIAAVALAGIVWAGVGWRLALDEGDRARVRAALLLRRAPAVRKPLDDHDGA